VVMTTLLALIGMATSAQAARFRRSWDPLFNVAFSPTLGWRGEAEIFVSDGCVSANSTVTYNASGVTTCGSANIESYTLEFYNVGTPLVNLDSFSDSTPGSPAFEAVLEVSFDNDPIANGVSLWGEIEVAGSFSFNNSSFTSFITFGLNSTSLRLEENCIYNQCTSYFSDVEPTVEWSQVPTPAPLALLGIGLLALAMTRRRIA
jgi:hypothetical protein